jgi:hypothetical protein
MRPPPRRTRGVVACAAAGLAVAAALGGSSAWAANTLGRLEQESLDEALAARALVPDPAPQGKIVGQIHVVNHEVFSRRDWWLQWFNIFHRTSREDMVRRDVLISPGEPYSEDRVQESIRYLQAPPSLLIGGRLYGQPDLSSVVIIVPVLARQPGMVDLLVVTRDLWSLRFNTDFEFQADTLVYLSTSLSENNLLGWRKYLSLGFLMDQGSMAVVPAYFDPNIRGTRLTMVATAAVFYGRDSQDYEGNGQTFGLRYPLYALSSRWGAGADVTHQNAIVRNFRGNEVRRLDVLDTPLVTDDDVPDTYRRKILTVDGNVVRSFPSLGGDVIQRVTLGHRIDSRSSELPPGGATTNPQAAALYIRFVAPVTEQRSEPYLRYDVFTPRYAVYRDLDTFDLRENRRLGPALSLSLGYGSPALGADRQALVMGAVVSGAIDVAGGYGRIQGQASARRVDDRLIDESFKADVYLASPTIARFARLVLSAEAGAVRDDTFRTRFFLGGRTGLRGYAIGDLAGTSLAVAHAELRTRPLAIASQRVGVLLFYDVGDAAPAFSAMRPYQDLGVGLRWLIPQFNASVLRVDWAIALRGTDFTRAGLPGRVTAGFLQVF